MTGCRSVEFPDVKLCSVAGIFAAGMDCAQTGSGKTTEMNAKEMIDFLESGAICMSAADRKREKTAIEQACYLLKDRCTFEVQEMIKRLDKVR